MMGDPAWAIQMPHQCRVIVTVIPVSQSKKVVMEGAQSMPIVTALTAEKVVMVWAQRMPTVMALTAEVRRAAHPQATVPQLVQRGGVPAPTRIVKVLVVLVLHPRAEGSLAEPERHDLTLPPQTLLLAALPPALV